MRDTDRISVVIPSDIAPQIKDFYIQDNQLLAMYFRSFYWG